MVRRPDTESDDSQKENIMPAAVKLEKSEKRPGRTTKVTGKDSEGAGPSEQTREDSGEEDEEDGSPRGKKRARVNEDGDSINADGEEMRASLKSSRIPFCRDKDNFVTGSIMRIKLHRFLTYDDVEFRPGPYLNMILGPNGTGKSSISCAICLGLNQSPKILGRAPEPAKYVKIGYEEGSIEIQLKGKPGNDNIVIRRVIKKLPPEGSKKDKSISTYFVNGKQVKGNLVLDAVQSLGIQIGNLCSFLPQDRVAEFARMTPQELLKATEAAAGDSSLTGWHEDLVKNGKELKDLVSGISSERADLETMEARNATLQREVERYEERRQIERKLELLELILPFKEYVDAKQDYAKMKKDRELQHQKVVKLQEKNKPFNDFKAKLESEHASCDRERNRRKKLATDKFNVIKLKWEENEKLAEDTEATHGKLDSLRKQERDGKSKIENLRKTIANDQKQLDNPPDMEESSVIDDDHRKNREEIVKANRDKANIEDEIKGFLDESARQDVVINRAAEDIKNLDNVSHRKLQELASWDKDTADAVVWLRENQYLFKMQVIEPPILCLSVPDQKFAASVEACFSAAQLRNFVTQCRDDFNLLNHKVNDTPEALGRKCHVGVWYRDKDEHKLVPPPMTPDQLHREGFQLYAIDAIECPDGLLWFLKRELNLHRTAIGLDGSKIDVRRVTDMVLRIGPDGMSVGCNFIAGSTLNNVKRSSYGRRLPLNMTRDVYPARNLKYPPVDQTKKKELEQRQADARANQDSAEAEVKQRQTIAESFERELKALHAEKEKIEVRRKNTQAIQKRLRGLQLKIEKNKEILLQEEKAPSVDKERQRLRKQLYETAKKRADIATDLQRLVLAVIEDHTEATRTGLRFIQLGANKKALEELCRNRNDAYTKAREAYEKINEEYSELKVLTKKKLDISKAKLAAIDDELRQTFEELEQSGQIHQQNVADILVEQETLRAKLELLVVTNPGVIEQFLKRQQEIEKFSERLEKKEKQKAELERTIKRTRDRWLPALKELVETVGAKFSNAFDGVGCAGEIRINEHPDDYSQWAIDILVKFRDNETLQLLTGQRQSGGERALTTIMYLMSLTEMARSPFSLVDEINQGMDQQYERAVHNSLVEVTCRAESGQYFLITPKLLTDLKYHERMKVLCVSNGEWLPDEEEHRCGNMMQMIQNFKKHRQSH